MNVTTLSATATADSNPANTDFGIRSIAVSGAGGYGVAGGASLATSHISGTLESSIKNGSTVAVASPLTLESDDRASILSISGQASGAVGGSFGLATSTNDITNVVTAFVADSAVTAPSVGLVAKTTALIKAYGIGGGGAVGIAAGASVVQDSINNTIDTHISGSSNVSGANGVSLTSTDNSDIEALGGRISGALGVSAAGADRVRRHCQQRHRLR